MAQLHSAVAPYLDASKTPSLEQLAHVAVSTHSGPVGGCISKVASRWAEAFPGSRAADVALNGVKLKLLVPKGQVMQSEGTFPQPPPHSKKAALILRHTILRMYRQGVCTPMTRKEATGMAQPPMYHRVWLREKKSDGDGDPDLAIKQQDWDRLAKILKAWRMIISLNLGVNKFGLAQKFKGRTATHAVQLLRTGDVMVYVDVEDAYYNVPLNKLYSRLCAFWMDDPVLRQLAPWGWKLLTLMFGLWSAPRDFILQLRAVLGLTLSWGIRLSDLMDDILLAATTVEQSLQHSMVLLLVLRHFNWRIKLEKLALIPSQVRDYGGWRISTMHCVEIDLPQQKWIKQQLVLKAGLSKMRRSSQASMREISRLYGILRSNAMAIFACPVWCKQTANHYAHLQRTQRLWDRQAPVPKQVVQELLMWTRPLFRRWLRTRLVLSPPGLLIAGDASGTQVGGKGLVPNSTLDSNGLLQSDPRCPNLSFPLPVSFSKVPIRHGHSTTTELFGALYLIMTYVLLLDLWDEHIMYLGDNTVCKAYLNRMGGRKRHLCAILQPFLPMFRRRRIRLSMGYRSGATMIRWDVDGLSRTTNLSELQLQPTFWRQLLEWFPTRPSLDMFASTAGHLLPTYWSRYPDLFSTAADAMLQPWDSLPTASWAFPPFSLIASILAKIANETTGQTVYMLVPFWFKQTWWPRLLSMLVSIPVLVPMRSTHLTHPCQKDFAKSGRLLRRKGWALLLVELSNSATSTEAFRLETRRRWCQSGPQALKTAILEFSPDSTASATYAHAVCLSLVIFCSRPTSTPR